jgi:hypothetical protein
MASASGRCSPPWWELADEGLVGLEHPAAVVVVLEVEGAQEEVPALPHDDDVAVRLPHVGTAANAEGQRVAAVLAELGTESEILPHVDDGLRPFEQPSDGCRALAFAPLLVGHQP